MVGDVRETHFKLRPFFLFTLEEGISNEVYVLVETQDDQKRTPQGYDGMRP